MLIDFGMAARYSPDQPRRGLMGSPGARRSANFHSLGVLAIEVHAGRG